MRRTLAPKATNVYILSRTQCHVLQSADARLLGGPSSKWSAGPMADRDPAYRDR